MSDRPAILDSPVHSVQFPPAQCYWTPGGHVTGAPTIIGWGEYMQLVCAVSAFFFSLRSRVSPSPRRFFSENGRVSLVNEYIFTRVKLLAPGP